MWVTAAFRTGALAMLSNRTVTDSPEQAAPLCGSVTLGLGPDAPLLAAQLHSKVR